MPAPPAPRFLIRPGHPDFLDLPWEDPLEAWSADTVVEVARGTSRHVVRFVAHGEAIYALKEMPRRLSVREYRLLRRMEDEGLPAVQAVGVVERRVGLEDVLITRYLDYSLPYRHLYLHRDAGFHDPRGLAATLLDALAVLLVRLHLAGFLWGDCSLSNTLFRRDAGALAAYLVDAETGEWHDQLTDGQRRFDLEVTEENIAGGLLDVEAELGVPTPLDPQDAAEGLRNRYQALWDALTGEVVLGPDERYLIDAHVRRLNDLGYDVDEVELVPTDGGERLRLRARVVEPGHHRRELLTTTGLTAQENQARTLLNDLESFRRAREAELGRPLPRSVAAYRWLSEVFEPTIAAVPDELRQKLEAAELFTEVLEHKWFVSERAGCDVGIPDAVAGYLADILPAQPDERLVLDDLSGDADGADEPEEPEGPADVSGG